ncbi:von Hippel-Lindau disease tumor suppressor-like [Argonauta hians]
MAEAEAVRLRSQPSYQQSYVRFMNRTERQVDIVWLNYEGVSVHYKTLSSQHWVDVNTFVGHPWIFRDTNTGDKLVVQLKEVYEPVAHCYQRDGTSRKVVNIVIPVYNLKECCLQKLRALIPSNQIDELELPKSLIGELKKYFHKSSYIGKPIAVSKS